MNEQYTGLNGYLGSTDRAVLLANGSGGLTAQGSIGWKISASGHFLASTDNTYDIGASGATRPRTGYFGTSVVAGKLLIRDSYVYGQPQIYHETFGTNTGFQIVSAGECAIYSSGTPILATHSITGIRVNGSTPIGWCSGQAITTPDLTLYRDAANTLALRNGLTAQAFNIYNTYTSSTNYEQLGIYWTGNNAIIETRKGSIGGSDRALYIGTSGSTNLAFRTNGTNKWYVVGSTGYFYAQNDNTYDIGASGANRPRTGYFGTSVIAPSFVPTTRQTYSASNVTTDRTYDANATTLDEVADVLGSLIADLRTIGLIL